MATPDDLGAEDFEELDEELDPLDVGEVDDVDSDEAAADDDSADDASDDDEADDADEKDEDNGDEAPIEEEDEGDEQEESLDVILAREQDLEQEFASSDQRLRSSPTSTPAGEGEFTCRSCFLVKRRAQLADADEMICFDCA